MEQLTDGWVVVTPSDERAAQTPGNTGSDRPLHPRETAVFLDRDLDGARDDDRYSPQSNGTNPSGGEG